MKVIMINKDGYSWTFDSVKEATPHINPKLKDDYTIQVRDGKKVRIYDDREYAYAE